MTPAEIWDEALVAGKAAAKKVNEELPPEARRGLDCGFAWVVIKPAKGAFVTWAKTKDLGSTRDYGGGGYQIWYSKFSEATQSISVHEAAAKAVAEVLTNHGVNATWSSRLD